MNNTNSVNNTPSAVVLPVADVNGEKFSITPTYKEMNDQVLMRLADQMLRELGGTLLMSQEVEFILNMEHQLEDHSALPFTEGDITNNQPTANIETLDYWEDMTEEEKNELVEELEEKRDEQEEDSEEWDRIDSLIDAANEADFENYPEFYQWFTMDDRLLCRLEEQGQCILDNKYWGRQAFGQTISMDHCIKKACYEIAKAWAN